MEGQAQEASPVGESPPPSGADQIEVKSTKPEEDFLKINSFLTDPPLPLLIARQTHDNFLTDKDLLQNHAAPDGSPRPLSGVFAIKSPSADWEIFWDPQTCRILGVLPRSKDHLPSGSTGKVSGTGSPSPPIPPLTATGPHPLRRTTGASGDPAYFGFRWLHGRPGFLYTIGSLVVEEWIWLEDPTLLCQHFRIREPVSDVIVLLPADWSNEVTSTAGTIKEGVLTVPAAEAAEFAITTRLKPTTIAPAP